MNSLLGSFNLAVLTTEMKIRLSIAYLVPLAEYQDVCTIYDVSSAALLIRSLIVGLAES